MIIDIPVALQSLRPNAKWHMIGTEYSNIYWDDETQTKPTEQEVEERIAVLKYQEEVNVYQEKRKSEYPSWEDQLDKIYHSGVDAWKEDVKAIKDKYPKQTMDPNELLNRKNVAVFNLQKKNYIKAKARLEQYELSTGLKEKGPDTHSSAEFYVIEPLPVIVGSERNPLVVQDERERVAAQEVINNTPQAVIDSVSS